MSIKSQIESIIRKGDGQASEIFGSTIKYEGESFPCIFLESETEGAIEMDGVYTQIQARMRLPKSEIKYGKVPKIGEKIKFGNTVYRVLTRENSPMDICYAYTLSKV